MASPDRTSLIWKWLLALAAGTYFGAGRYWTAALYLTLLVMQCVDDAYIRWLQKIEKDRL